MILCREMKASDVSVLAEIERANFSRPWSEESLLKELGNDNSIFITAECEGNIAGYGGMYLIGTEGDITNIVVSSLYRQRGVASAIISSIIDNAKKHGITEITLEVRESNKAAVQLYGKYGFRFVGKRPGFYDFPKEDALIMWLRDI